MNSLADVVGVSANGLCAGFGRAEEPVDLGHAGAGQAPFPEGVDAFDDFGGESAGDLVA